MDDTTKRRTGRRQGSLLSPSGARPSPARSSLLGQAVEKERARQAHRDAALRRKPAAGLFAGWDDRPDPPATGHGEAAAPAAPVPVAAMPAEPAVDTGFRPLVDPIAVLRGIASSRLLILSTTILGAAAGVLIALSTPKQYVSWAEVLVDPRDLQIVDRGLSSPGFLPADTSVALIENQMRIMRSRPVLSRVVEALHLDNDPEFNGAGHRVGLGEVLAMVRAIVSGDARTAGEQRAATAGKALAERVEIERSGKTFVVEVSARTEDPAKSALIANTVVDVYFEQAALLQSESAGRASGELVSRLDELRKELETAERAVEDYKAQNDLVDAKGSLIGDEELVKLNDQLATVRARTLEINAKAATARGLSADRVIAGELPEQVANAGLAQLRTQYAAIAQEAAKAASRLGPRHPERLAIEAQLADARTGIERELRRIVASIQVDLKRAVQLEQDLSTRLAQLKARQANVSDKLVTLREMEREATAKRNVYEQFLLRAKETGEQSAINSANVAVIARATPPVDPSTRSRSMTAILGMVAGFVAGLALAALRGAWAGLDLGALGGHRPAPSPQRPGGGTRARHPAAAAPSVPEVPQRAPAEDRVALPQTAADTMPAPAAAATPLAPAPAVAATPFAPAPAVAATAFVPVPPVHSAPPPASPMMAPGWVQAPPGWAPWPMAMPPGAWPHPGLPAFYAPMAPAPMPPTAPAMMPAPVPAAAPAAAPADDPRLGRLRDNLSRFRTSVEALAAGRRRA